MSNPLLELLRARRATRAISSDPVDPGAIDDMIEAARLTPSCRNNQPWRFLFLAGPEALEKGREALAEGNRSWAGRAPLLIIAYTRREDDCVIKDGRAYHEFDLGMSVMSIMLAATHHGLTARPMAGFSPEKARTLFDLPPGAEPLVMLAVGTPSADESHVPEHYRGIESRPRERRSASEIVTRM